MTGIIVGLLLVWILRPLAVPGPRRLTRKETEQWYAQFPKFRRD